MEAEVEAVQIFGASTSLDNTVTHFTCFEQKPGLTLFDSVKGGSEERGLVVQEFWRGFLEAAAVDRKSIFEGKATIELVSNSCNCIIISLG